VQEFAAAATPGVTVKNMIVWNVYVLINYFVYKIELSLLFSNDLFILFIFINFVKRQGHTEGRTYMSTT